MEEVGGRAFYRQVDVLDGNAVRLLPVTTEGAVESIALMGTAKADLAVARGDLEMPADAMSVAIVRKNVVVLWAPSGLAGKGGKKPAPATRAERTGYCETTPYEEAMAFLDTVKANAAPNRIMRLARLGTSPHGRPLMAVTACAKITRNATTCDDYMANPRRRPRPRARWRFRNPS